MGSNESFQLRQECTWGDRGTPECQCVWSEKNKGRKVGGYIRREHSHCVAPVAPIIVFLYRCLVICLLCLLSSPPSLAFTKQTLSFLFLESICDFGCRASYSSFSRTSKVILGGEEWRIALFVSMTVLFLPFSQPSQSHCPCLE